MTPNKKYSFLLIIGMTISLLGSQIVRIYAQQPQYFEHQWTAVVAWYLVSGLLGVVVALASTAMSARQERGEGPSYWTLSALLVLFVYLLINSHRGQGLSSKGSQLALLIGLSIVIGATLAGIGRPLRHKLIHGACFVALFSTLGNDVVDFGRLILSRPQPEKGQVAQAPRSPTPPRTLHIFEILLDAMPGYDYVHDPQLVREAFFHSAPAGIFYPNAYANAHKTSLSLRQMRTGKFSESRKRKNLLSRLSALGYKVNLFSEISPGPCKPYPNSTCYDRKWALETGMFRQERTSYLLFEMNQLLNSYLLRVQLAGLNGKFSFAALPERGTAAESMAKREMWKEGKSASLVLFREYLRSLDTLKEPSYNFLHLKLPHAPNIHDRECTVIGSDAEIMMPASELRAEGISDQILCANKLAKIFLKELVLKGLFDGSLVMIHSDHGNGPGYLNFIAGSRFLDSESGFSRNEIMERRARALLWVKPPHFKGRETRAHTALLLDIPATLSSQAGLSLGPIDGMDLITDYSKERADVMSSREIYAANEYSADEVSYVIRRLSSGDWTEVSMDDALAAASRQFVPGTESRFASAVLGRK